jgi:predicted SprT family Zn-dependent metalloprotease
MAVTDERVLVKLAEARAVALALMEEHGLTAAGWVFEWDRAKRRAGVCKYPTASRGGRIGLSVYFVAGNGWDEIRDTLLHEVSHALVGKEAGHGPAWQAVCRRIGARPLRCYDPGTVSMPKGRFRAVCPSCGTEHHRHRRPRPVKYHCRRCRCVLGALTWATV